MFDIPDYQTIIASIEAVFQLIFPEFPAVGLPVTGLTLVLFVFYFIKADIKQALKISLSSLAMMLFILFLLHSLNKFLFVVV